MSDEPETQEFLDENAINRVTNPIASQEEADGLRAALERRKNIEPPGLTPIMEEANAFDEARLAQWDAKQPRSGAEQTAEAPHAEQEAD